MHCKCLAYFLTCGVAFGYAISCLESVCGTKASELCCRLNLTQPESKADGVRGPGGAVALAHSADAIGASHFLYG